MHRLRLLSLIGLTMLLVSISPALAQRWAVRTNVLALATGNINADLSLALGSRISLHLPIQYRPYTLPVHAPIGLLHWMEGDLFNTHLAKMGKLDHAENLTVMPGLRYWMNGVYNRGLFFGAHAVGKLFTYGGTDLVNRYKDGYALGGGLSVGYSLELSPRWNIEAEIGGSAYWRTYDLHRRDGAKLTEGLTDMHVALSRLGISLTYLL